MDREQIRALLKDVLGPNIPLVDHAKWVGLRCPLAMWTHSDGFDKKPSAGVSVKPDGVSIFNCMACHRKYPLSGLLEELGELKDEDYSSLIGGLAKEEYFGGNLGKWGEKKTERTVLPEPLDVATYLDLYEPAYSHPYLESRGIDPQTAEFIDIRLDPEDSEGAERVVFPVYHHEGGFYGFTGRAVDPEVYPPIRDYHGLPKEFLLLGSHLIQPTDDYLIVVEGLFDFAKLVSYGLPAVAYMGGTLTEHQIDALIDIDLPVYFFRDNDLTGERAQDRLKESRLCKHLPVMKVRYPKRMVRGKDGKRRPVKDPDELSQEEVLQMKKDARLL